MKNTQNPKEKGFRPTLFFLLRFGLFYLLLSLSYGRYIRHYDPVADPMTDWVAYQVYYILKVFGENVSMQPTPGFPSVDILIKGEYTISVFEGCNGIILWGMFMVFIVAFLGNVKKMLWFIPLGILSIHVLNLGRLVILTYMAYLAENAATFHFFHKYFFTGLIYGFILLLWYLWARMNRKSQKEDKATHVE